MMRHRIPSLALLLCASLASLATECGQRGPRGLEPTQIATVRLLFASRPAAAPPPVQTDEYEACLQRMGQVTNVAPSWRNFQTIPLIETMPNNFEMSFNDVPVGVTNSMAVRDRNECRRDPRGNGRVVTGVSINGTPIETVDPASRGLFFTIDATGMVSSPSQPTGSPGG